MATVSRGIMFGDGRVAEAALTVSEAAPWSIGLHAVGLAPIETDGRDLFDALCAMREQLAAGDAVLLVQGAAADVYPSGMMREAGGRMAYRYAPGRPARREDVVDILAPAEWPAVTTVAQQKENFAAWIRSLTPQP